MSEYGLVLSFLDQSRSFAYGFACGQIWASFESGDFQQRMVHADTFDQVVAMALKFGKRVCVVEGHVDYFDIRFDPILRVVN